MFAFKNLKEFKLPARDEIIVVFIVKMQFGLYLAENLCESGFKKSFLCFSKSWQNPFQPRAFIIYLLNI